MNVNVGDEIIYRVHPKAAARRGIIARVNGTLAVTVYEIGMDDRKHTGVIQVIQHDKIYRIVSDTDQRDAIKAYDRAMGAI